jgi:hypothetical protein
MHDAQFQFSGVLLNLNGKHGLAALAEYRCLQRLDMQLNMQGLE